VISTIKQQVKEFRDELNRVDWPAKDKVWSSAMTVVAVSVAVGFFLFAADWLLSKGFGYLLPHK
jgi:preprotein translocase SecE subunit